MFTMQRYNFFLNKTQFSYERSMMCRHVRNAKQYVAIKAVQINDAKNVADSGMLSHLELYHN